MTTANGVAASPSAPSVNEGKAEAAAEGATKQAGFNFKGKGTQESGEPDLTKMSGSELREYFEAQKAAGKEVKIPTKDARYQDKGEKKAPGQDLLKEAAKEATEAVRKYKVKVDGEELEVDESELLRGYSHQKAANKILQQGVQARKQAEEFIAMMKDPAKFYETAAKLGHDPRHLAEEYLARQLEDELMDPRDKELKDAKQKLKQIEELERAQKEALEAKRNEVLKQKYAQDYSNQFVEALQSSGLPPTKPMVAEMAKYVSRAAKIGFKMTAQEAAQLVYEDVQTAHQKLIGDSDGETLMKLLGEQTANKIRKFDTQRLGNPEKNLRTPTDQPEARKRTSTGKRMSAKEWREFNRR